MQEQILLAGSTEKSRMLLQTLLPPGTNPPPRMCMSGAETRRALGEDDWPLLVINTPLSDESGIDLAIDAASHTATSVLMLVKAELADQVQAQLENYGVFVVAKPVARPLFDQAIRYAAVLRNRLMTACAEKAKLEKKLADLKKDLFYLRMQHATNQLDNPLKIRETKRDIARVMTVMRELQASDKQ